ncbi:apolipophorins isoform X2 [Euwallacea fornicatus]|uniref:apolipophorins isoform X2 n=1 Tax=Euwallacea fornicatus TaxID=995702 RepID=UPI00338F74CC
MDGNGQRRVPLGIVCLVLLVIGSVQTDETCRTGCKGGQAQTFKYAVGTTYKYTYEGKIDISLSSAEGQTTGTELKANVLLTQLPDCNQLLRLQNVQISGSNGKKFGAIPDIEKPIRINIHDGLLEDSICVVDGDNQNSINVKRAIASIFQASLKSNYETDVFGRCPTDLTSHKEGNVVVIRKTRSLNRCSYREHNRQDFLSTALNLNSEIKSSPILTGDYSAALKVKNGILDQASVTEDYLYVPFSVGKNGAKAQIVSKLHLSGTSKESPQAPVSKPRSIIFENPHPMMSPTTSTTVILNTVKEVAKTIDVVVSENTAKEFLNLLRVVRVSSKNNLLTAYNQVKGGVGVGDKDSAKRIYLDALLRAGSGEAVEALLELLDKKQLDEIDSKLVLLSLNVVRHATEGSLKAATHLLNIAQLPREAYLGIGNLAGRFCQQHSCENNAELKALTAKLLSKISPKLTTREQENDAVFALKALANIKQLNDAVIAKVTALAQNKNLANRIRVAALEAYLADSCKEKLRNSALLILQDFQQDSEVRIKAYLVLAQCPNAKIGSAVKTLLTKESSIQVGGFISSHIRALHASANPDKALAKQFLGFSIKKSFPIDPRKYSFSGEFSYSVDSLGLAASTEANVIYSQNSWLPRSTSLNLTAEVFGHNLNFLEIETRQENLDRLIEHYFGPKGALRPAVLLDIVKEGKLTCSKIAEYIQRKLETTLQRSRRDVSKAEIDHIAKQVQIKTNELNKDLDLDISLKAFGSEVLFLNVNQESRLTPEAIIDDIIAKFSKGLDKLQRFEETYRRNMNFLNAELDYPTSLGFPLRLAVEGSANIQIKAEGNIDLREIINNPDKGEFRAKIIPSVNIEVIGRLSLDALVVENGLKIISNLYSSTGTDLKVIWDKTSGFDLRVGLPVKEQKLVSATHELVFVTRDQGVREEESPLKFTQVKDFSICLDQLSPFIGLTFCAEVNGPNLEGNQIPLLPFPLAGDSKIAVTIENDDILEYSFRNSYKQSHVDFVFEAIGNNQQKKVVLDLQAESAPERYIKATFNAPEKTALAEARIVSTNVEKSLVVKLSLDQNEYYGKAGILVSGTPEKAAYKPILEYKTPQGQQPLPIAIDGQVVVEQSRQSIKYSFQNLKVADAQNQGIINGNLGRDAEGVYFGDVTLSNGVQSLGLQGRLQLVTALNLMKSIKFNVKVQNSINKNANFNLKGELKMQPSHYDATLQLIHGADLNSKTAILTFTTSFVNKFKDPTDFRFETKNSLTYPLLGVNGKFELEHTPKTLDYDVNLQYGELKLGSELEAKINEKAMGDFEVEFDLWGLDNKLEIKSKREVLPNEESKIHHSLELNGKKFELEGKVTHNIKPQNVDVGAELTVHVPSQAAPIKVSVALRINQEEVDTHAKITSGSEPFLDSFFKANRKGSANGSVKINIKGYLTVSGQLHANDGVGNGDVLIDIQGGKRQIKADTTFTIQPVQVFDVTVNLYPSYHKDKNLKILLSTQNKVSETSLDSRNKLNIAGYPLEVNVKGTRIGGQSSHKIDGELEITLPDRYFISRINNERQLQNDLITDQSHGSLEYRKNKNAPGYKLTFKSSLKDTNIKEGIIDAELNLSAEDGNGKNIISDFSLKTDKRGEEHQLSWTNKHHGSVLNKPLELHIMSKCKKGLTTQYEVRVSHGSANTLNVKGSHDLNSETKRGSLMVQLATVAESLKTLSVDLSGTLVNVKSDLPFQIQGQVNAQATNSKGSILDLKSGGNVHIGLVTGAVKGNFAINQVDPIAVEASYNVKEQQRGVSGTATVTYGKGQTLKGDFSLERSPNHQYKIIAGLQTPFEGYKTSKFEVNTRATKDYKQIASTVDLAVDSKNWKIENEVELSDLSPVINIKLTGSDGKLRQFYAKGNRISDKHFGAEVKIVNEEKAFLLDGSIDINVENLQKIIVKGQLHSPTLNFNKITLDAHSSGESNAQKIIISIKAAGKNYISGTWSYAAKDENGKYIVDGSGSLKVKEESRTGHFKYIFDKLEQAKDQEEGVRISFDATLGERALDTEFKVTNKHFKVQGSYCEQKKECAYVEIENKVDANDAENFNQILEINLDLRKLGLLHEFGLKAVTVRKGWLIDHTVDAHFQNQENSKYQYSFYLHPKDVAVSLTTPKRIVALEGKIVPLKNFREGGISSGELSFYLDKRNQANKKTAVTWLLDVDNKGKVKGEVKLSHPGLRKSLLGSFTAIRDGNPFNGKLDISVELDVFAHDNQKLVLSVKKAVTLELDSKAKGLSSITYSLQSKGLGVDIQGSEVISGDKVKKEFSYENKFIVNVGQAKFENVISHKWSPQEISGLIKLSNTVILKGIHKILITENDQTIESEVSSYDNTPLVGRLEIKNYNTLTYTVWVKNEPNKKLLLNAGLIPGQVADIRADRQNGGSKINLFYATLKLDEANFLKSEHKVDSKAIQDVLKSLKDRSVTFLGGLNGVGKDWTEEVKTKVQGIGETAKKAIPNLQPIKQYYSQELQKIKEEILSDKSIQALGEAIRQVVGSTITAITTLFEKLSQQIEEATVVLQKSFQEVIDAIEKKLIPQLKELGSKVLKGVNEAVQMVLSITLGVVAKASEILEKYQPELQELATTLGELFQDLGKLVYKVYDNSYENVKEVTTRIINEAKASPYLDRLKSEYNQFIKQNLPSSEALISSLREIFNTIKDVISPEFIIKEDVGLLLDSIANYAEQKLQNKDVDDLAALENIAQRIAVIVKKLVSLVTTEGGHRIPGGRLDTNSILPLSYLKNLPRLVAIKFSPVHYLFDQEVTTEVGKLLLTLVNKPKNLIPPFPLFGLVAQGTHVFTFDGKHITFPGKCNYLLARDAVNGNFTVAGSYKDGHLTSITLSDESGSVTLLQGGKVKANDKIVDLPRREPTLAAYRNYEVITLFTTAGVLIECPPDLIGCAVKVSGFYHGQIRGLLGNGNNEPFDDFTIPNGRIVTAEAQFINAYKLATSCADVTTAKQDEVKENSSCKKLFSWESSLRLCYPFVPVENFKTACALGLAANVKDTEQAIAKAYVTACQNRNIPVHVPDNLVQCTNGDKPYNVGDQFSVKLPGKSADIVIIVETTSGNQKLYEKLGTMLITEISADLRSKGVKDIEYHLITYGGQNQWPSHVTVNGKLTFTGKPPALKFSEEPPNIYDTKAISNPRVKEFAEELKTVVHDLSLATGLNLKTETYNDAYHYHFRANSLKSIIVLNEGPCEVGKFYALQKALAYTFTNRQIALNLFTALPSLSMKDSKKTKDVIGFNTQNVFALSQAKKHPKGSTEMHRDLSYDDYCVDFTLHNRGTTFVNENFLTLKDADQKQFAQVAALNIVDELITIEQGLDCECKFINPWTAVNTCKEAYSKDRPSKKV